MQTKVSSATREVLIGDERPTVLIGERINPTGKKKLASALQAGDLEVLRQEAIVQVQDGADILDVNVGLDGLDETTLLPQVVRMVMDTVDVPLCLDSHDPRALAAALRIYRGKPIINSVNGQEASLNEVLPLVKEYGAAVIGLAMDDRGIPQDVERRVAIAHRIVERAAALGIPREDVIMDCLALSVGTDTSAARVTLGTIQRVRAELGVNQTLGASNISFGLPDRDVLNGAFLGLAIAAGITCPVVDAAKVRSAVLATDLLLGRDEYARRYIRAFRQRQAQGVVGGPA
jgi:5-methyltetrahydrofolate--homocysteine methyltransferase